MTSRLFLCVLCLLASTDAVAQGVISTVAGGNGFLDNVPAVQARISGPNALAVDASGNAYIGDGARVRRVAAATGTISTVTAATGAQSLALDKSGILLAVYGNQFVRLNPGTGAITGIPGFSNSSPQILGNLAGLATDSAGDIFVTDGYNDEIYRIDAVTGAVSTFAGIGMVGYTGSPQGDGGPATLAGLLRPSSIAVDPFGNVFFVEQYWLRRIDGKTGMITTIARQSNSGIGGSGDGGSYSQAVLANATALATDAKGNLYIADASHIREIVWSTGIISTIAGTGQLQYAGDGVPALQANLSYMTALSVDGQSNLWIADSGNARLFVVPAATGLIRTVAGTSENGDGGPALGALLPNLTGLAVNAEGDLYFAAGGIRRVDHSTGNISTVAFGQTGNLVYGGLGNGASPIAIDSAGNLFVAAPTSVQRVDAITGTVTSVTGDGQGQYGGGPLGDGGPATKAQVTPSGVAIDPVGNLYIADYWNFRIRRVDAATGIITTIAGNGQGQTYSGLTGLAPEISIGVPASIAIAPNGDVYWSTGGWVLKVNSAGMLSVAAGEGGGCIYSGDGGTAQSATLCIPSAIAFDRSGNLFVTESMCGCIRRVDAETGLIQTVAGTGTPVVSGDVSNDGGPATQLTLTPGAIAVYGNALYLVDAPGLGLGAARVRALIPPVPPTLPQPPVITQVTNGVDYMVSFSPGAIVSVFGNYLGPQTPAAAQTGANGLISSSLAGDRVSFSGIPAPLLYVSAGQINAVIPYSIKSGPLTVQAATGQGTYSFGNLFASSTSLALLSGLVFNPDGTLNSATNPAPKGATLVMFGTGMGQTSPAAIDGSIVQGPPFPMPVASFSATVTNATTQYKATVSYLGPLPGFIAGAVQANVQIPATVPAGVSSLNLGPANGSTGAQAQTIHMLSDAPVLTGISPASPIPESVGAGIALTLNGEGLTGVATVSLSMGGQPVSIQPQLQSCTSVSCSVVVYFNGAAGQYGVTVTNPAGQVSNQLMFVVQPYSPPTVTGVYNGLGTGPVIATKGNRFVDVTGTNFLTPETVNLYYNGAKVASFSSSDASQLQIAGSAFLAFTFDFQGNAGQYAVEVIGSNGDSGLFGFTVAAS